MSDIDLEKAIEASKATFEEEQEQLDDLKRAIEASNMEHKRQLENWDDLKYAIEASKDSYEQETDCSPLEDFKTPTEGKHDDCLDEKTNPVLVAAEGYTITSDDLMTAIVHEASYASKSIAEQRIIDDDYALALSLVGKA